MEDIITQIIDAVGTGGPLAIVGWGLFALERFYVAPKREASYKEQVDDFKRIIETFREDHITTSNKTVDALHNLTTLLEIVKDRAERS